jgi:preprotein translocase subunit SecG
MNILNFLCRDENAGTAAWVVDSWPIIKIVIMALLAVFSIAMIVLVVMQKSNTNGISAISGQTDTFYNRNKGATLQGKIKNWTIVCAVVIMALCIIFLIMNQIYQGTI